MFVKAASGLCPLCFTRRRRREERVQEVVHRQVDAAIREWLPDT
jgi:hypothetical protein